MFGNRCNQLIPLIRDPFCRFCSRDVATTIPGSTVVALPLNSRNFIQLAQLAPGVELPPGTLLPRINGGRPRTNEYLYDGISALQPEPGQVELHKLHIRAATLDAGDLQEALASGASAAVACRGLVGIS